MKRIISAFVLLFICIGICIYGSVVTEKKCEALTNKLDILEKEINEGENENALSLIKDLEKEWKKAEKFFSSVSETALIDELDLSLGSMEKYILSDKKEEAVIVIEECRCGLETISRRQKISVENIL